ncbi:glutamate:gamma-aminobutyrate antiporter [Escherichia coli]
MRNLCFLLTLVATLLLPGRLIAAALPQDEKLITGQLDNGLRYMIYPHAHPKDQVNLWLQIHTGSLQEEDNERGVAHFVEHMMFNGTKTWPGNKVIETFESMGLRFGRDVNAYTSYDETVYQVSLPTTQKQNLGLCAAEMATVDGWEEGGVFAWVSNTLGPRWGFAAISFGYLQIAIGFIPMLYFVLGALSYILKWPALNEDPITKTIAALIILWALALTQFGGTKYTARIAKVGFFAGILLPAFILIALAAIYLHSGAPVAIEMDSKTFFPDFSKVGTLVVFVAFILSYMGVEASATHVNEMSNPGRDYPLAMLLLMVAAICLSSVGGLSIAMVIPGNEINLSAGVMQTFTVLMSHVAPEIEWTVRVISALLLLGVLAEIASWIVGPSRGMYVTAQKNLLPAAFAKMNKNGVPVTLVISQLVITSIALIILTNTGGGNNMSFLIALALTVVIYLCAYFMLFIGYIVLVLKHPDLKRTFNIPGGKGVKLVVAIVGLLTSIMAFIVSFLPPDNIQGDSTDMYVELLVVSFLVVLALPFILYAVHDRKGKANTGVTLEPINSQNAPKGHFFLHPRARSPHYIVMNDKKH